MKINKFALPLLLTAFCLSLPSWAGTFNFLKINDQRSTELRATGPSARAEVQRSDAASGRRLTPAELAELRQQVRQQWSPRQDVARSAESQPAERMVPAPDSKGATLGSPGRPQH